tara:strand:+ start:1148 stop:1534 length:387 start_codon:yes stop_codon:yes gene_type:complete
MEFYNDKYECTYRLSESTEEYQKDLLNVVDMRNNYTTAPDSRTVDTEAIVEKISKIYTEMDDKEMAEIYKYCKENIIYLQDCNDDICFIFLFGYDTLDVMHKILISYKKEKKVDRELKDELLDKLSGI